MSRITIPIVECPYCKHRWIPRKANPCCCPNPFCHRCSICKKSQPHCKCRKQGGDNKQ